MYRTLVNAPIREAVIDLRASFAELPDEEKFDRFREALHREFPKSAPMRDVKFQINLSTEQASPTFQSNGVRFEGTDETEIILCGSQSVSYSKLRPYDTWESFTKRAAYIAEIYWDVFEPEQVSRISTRFINDIGIPDERFDFDDYLKLGPQIPDGLHQELSEFQNRLVSPQPDGQTVIILAMAFPGPGVESSPSIVLDIDVVRNRLYANTSAAFESLEELRELKNLAFFNSITEKTLELFNG